MRAEMPLWPFLAEAEEMFPPILPLYRSIAKFYLFSSFPTTHVSQPCTTRSYDPLKYDSHATKYTKLCQTFQYPSPFECLLTPDAARWRSGNNIYRTLGIFTTRQSVVIGKWQKPTLCSLGHRYLTCTVNSEQLTF